MTQCPDDLQLEAYVDGQAGADQVKIACHVASCADCRAKVEELQSLNQLIRHVEGQRVAPRELVDRLRKESLARTTAKGHLNRRLVLRGGLAAAACLGGVVAYQSYNRPSAYELKSTLFGDFLTLVAADRQLDYQSGDSASVVAWFQSRVPFKLPDLAGLGGLEIRGGRLCWLAERRFAAMDFGAGDSAYCLYICQDDKLTVSPGQDIPTDNAPAVVMSERGISGAFWREGSTALSLVGGLPKQNLADIAGIIQERSQRWSERS